MYAFTQPFGQGQDVTQSQFLSRLELVWIKLFSFSLAGCFTKAKEPRVLFCWPIAWRGKTDSCLFQGHQSYVECKHPHAGYEVEQPIPLPTTIFFTLSVPPVFYADKTKKKKKKKRKKGKKQRLAYWVRYCNKPVQLQGGSPPPAEPNPSSQEVKAGFIEEPQKGNSCAIFGTACLGSPH